MPVRHAALYEAAPEETRRLVTTLLEQDVAERDWAAQAGPRLTQSDTGRLLGMLKALHAIAWFGSRTRARTAPASVCTLTWVSSGVAPS
ncbi:MAG: hypothetical protein ACR2KP_07960 [Egibacteraceae bacterium]